MRVMPANHSSAHALAAEYGHATVGHLYSPDGYRSPRGLAFALDNGCFKRWDEAAYLRMCDRAAAAGLRPLWQLVPDVVADRDATLRLWDVWATRLQCLYHWPLAIAVQDGMTPADIPVEASVVFVGGSRDWKRQTAPDWCARFPRVHVGRVTTDRWLYYYARAGAESVDGTGFYRGDRKQLAGLHAFLAWQNAGAAADDFAHRHSCRALVQLPLEGVA